MDSAPLLSLLGGLTQGYGQGVGTAYQRNMAMMQMQSAMAYKNAMASAAVSRAGSYGEGVQGKLGYYGDLSQYHDGQLAQRGAEDVGKGIVPAGATPQPNPVAPQPSLAPPTDPSATPQLTPPGASPVINTGTTSITSPVGLGPMANLKLRQGNAGVNLTAARTGLINDQDGMIPDKDALLKAQAAGTQYKNQYQLPSQVALTQAQTGVAQDQAKKLGLGMPFVAPEAQAQIGLHQAQTRLDNTLNSTTPQRINSTIALQQAQALAAQQNAATNQSRTSISAAAEAERQREFGLTLPMKQQGLQLQQLNTGARLTQPHTNSFGAVTPPSVPLDPTGQPTGPLAGKFNHAVGVLPPMPVHPIPNVGSAVQGFHGPAAPPLPSSPFAQNLIQKLRNLRK